MATLRAKRVISAPTRAAPAAAKKLRAHVLDVPFASRSTATSAGAKWDADHGVFVWRGDALPRTLAPFRAQPYSWELAVERELNDDAAPAASRPATPMTPRAHQRDAIRAIGKAREAGRDGFLLADDVGLGKTLSAWESVRSMRGAETVLIVCPLAVVAHWRRTIEAAGDGGLEVVVINYDRLGKLFEVTPEARKKVRTKKGLARAGTAPEYDVVVWDESHRCKNPTAARSKLAAKINASAGFTLWLSATAGQNPLELSYLAPLLAKLTGSRAADLKDFEQWCMDQGLGVTRGAYGKWSWRGDRRDCEKVRAMLFDGASPAGLRRRPEDIAGWPEINRCLTPIGLDGAARELYDEAWTEFRQAMELDPAGRNPKGALAATLRFRQKASLLRVSGTAELVRELLENGHQVAISVAFIETLEAIRTDLMRDDIECATLHGRMGAIEREHERLRFQKGDATVILFTMEEGISLHQGEHNDVPRSEVIHDLRWSAIQMAQIEGRCHRDGRFAQVYWAYADDTLEARIADIVCKRIQSMKAMVGDDVETLREIERLLADARAETTSDSTRATARSSRSDSTA